APRRRRRPKLHRPRPDKPGGKGRHPRPRPPSLPRGPNRPPVDDTKLPLTAHLAELRNRIIKLLLAWAIASGASWTYHEEIFAFLMRPALAALAPDGGRLQAIAPGEIFFTYMKCALLAGFVLALPVVFWQIWGFVSPGLYPQEKRVALPFVVVSTLLFISGAAFGYVAVFPAMFTF